MTLWSAEAGEQPVFWFEPLDTLPAASVVTQRILHGAHSKVVALVGYHEDSEASRASRSLPYGNRGEGIEEIVFVRAEPIDRVVEFDDDAWPGEDRTFVQDDLAAAIELIVGFAVEYDPATSAVLVTGDAEFLSRVAEAVLPEA